MPIAKSKEELLEAMETEYRLLMDSIDRLKVEELNVPGVCHEWSVKDVIAHLVDWKLMFLGWYGEGLRGGDPVTPHKDFKWNQTPALNAQIHRKWRNESSEEILRQFKSTYASMFEIAKTTPADQLFQQKLYPWMRTWPLARWIAANTSSHYRWARTRIRRWANAKRRQAGKAD